MLINLAGTTPSQAYYGALRLCFRKWLEAQYQLWCQSRPNYYFCIYTMPMVVFFFCFFEVNSQCQTSCSIETATFFIRFQLLLFFFLNHWWLISYSCRLFYIRNLLLSIAAIERCLSFHHHFVQHRVCYLLFENTHIYPWKTSTHSDTHIPPSLTHTYTQKSNRITVFSFWAFWRLQRGPVRWMGKTINPPLFLIPSSQPSHSERWEDKGLLLKYRVIKKIDPGFLLKWLKS